MFWSRRRDPVDGLFAIIQRQREDLAGERAARAYAMQRMSELKLEHLRETEDLRRRLAISQANFEWLTVSLNQANAERQALFNTRTSTNLPPVQIEFNRPAAEPPSMPEREIPRDRVDQPDVASLVEQGLSFADVGDRAAAILGLDNGGVYDDVASLLTT